MDVRISVIGRSVERRAIRSHMFVGAGDFRTLILAAMHGDEPKTVFVARQCIEKMSALPPDDADFTVCLVPEVNPDGYAQRRRTNSNRVDLNRNFPTADWTRGKKRSRYYSGPHAASEPETRSLMRWVHKYRPARIITLHSITGDRQCNNYNGAARGLARRLSRLNGYPVKGHIGYPTPGCFGTWAGIEQSIPTVTLELPSRTSRERDWESDSKALMAALRP